MRYRERFDFERESCRLGSDESQDQDKHEEEDDNKEKDNEKKGTSDGETKRRVTFSINVGRARILDWWRGQHSESGKR